MPQGRFQLVLDTMSAQCQNYLAQILRAERLEILHFDPTFGSLQIWLWCVNFKQCLRQLETLTTLCRCSGNAGQSLKQEHEFHPRTSTSTARPTNLEHPAVFALVMPLSHPLTLNQQFISRREVETLASMSLAVLLNDVAIRVSPPKSRT
jgi:hypothetical protein